MMRKEIWEQSKIHVLLSLKSTRDNLAPIEGTIRQIIDNIVTAIDAATYEDDYLPFVSRE